LDQLGVLLVAAVGNEGLSEPRYPAAYPSVIGVGAVDRAGQRYARGNRGPDVEILAPGVEILSTVPGGSFAFGDGTSLAAANVTGLLAVAVGASSDPRAARSAFFAAAQARAAAPSVESAPMPTAWDGAARRRPERAAPRYLPTDPVGMSRKGRSLSTRTSGGSRSTRSAMMFLRISSVPPAIRSPGAPR